MDTLDYGVLEALEPEIHRLLQDSFLAKQNNLQRTVFLGSNHLVLFESLHLIYYDDIKNWKISYEKQDLLSMLGVANSSMGMIKYIEVVDSMVKSLREILPQLVPGSIVLSNTNRENFNKCLILCQLQEKLTQNFGYKAYLSIEDEIVINEIQLSITLDDNAISNQIKKRGSITEIRIPYDSNTTLYSLINDEMLLENIKKLTLYSFYSENPDSEKSFKREFNNVFSYFFGIYDRERYKIDFYEQIKSKNSDFDLIEMYLFYTDSLVEAEYIMDSLAEKYTFYIKPQTKLYKTLQGYFYLRASKQSIGFLSLEEYDEISRKKKIGESSI